MDDGFDVSEVADAFALVANETRLGVLRALGDRDEYWGSPLPFSELRERAGVRDSGQFNYHLGELVGEFVAESEDGYALILSDTRT